MDHIVRVQGWFDASHQAETRQRCRRHHGHRWTVAVEALSTKKLDPDEADALGQGLTELLNEWHDRDLNEMIPNFAEPTPERLAPWIMERLLAVNPQMTEVSVSDGVVTAAAQRNASGLPGFMR